MSRRGVQGFRPERLNQALAARRLTQAQLASLIGVAPATISKWKSGTQSPERVALDRLASVVNVTPEWFTRPSTSSVSRPMFRSNNSAHATARAMLEARLGWVEELASALSEFVDYPHVNIPVRNFEEPDEISHADIETAASECRELWKLGRGPIQDVVLAAESAGVIVTREQTNVARIEGVSAWSESLARPFVLLTADKDNGYRSRFDLAHELGHIVLHRHIARPTERERFNHLEKQAHTFAGALLLPAESIAQEVRTPVTLDDLLLLKRRWGVSASAIAMRLSSLGILRDVELQTFFKRRSARWGARTEPGDGDRTPEQPRLMRRTIELLVKEGIMPLSRVVSHVGLANRDIEMLAGLPDGYFDGNGAVIEFVKVKEQTASSASRQPSSSNVVPFRPPRE